MGAGATREVEAELPPNPPVSGCDAVRREVSKYGWDARIMAAVAQAENRQCDPLKNNLGPSENHKVCIGSYGVLQVGCFHFREGEDRNDLATNIRVAYRVWLKQSYTAWSMYRNGAYKEYLR